MQKQERLSAASTKRRRRRSERRRRRRRESHNNEGGRLWAPALRSARGSGPFVERRILLREVENVDQSHSAQIDSGDPTPVVAPSEDSCFCDCMYGAFRRIRLRAGLGITTGIASAETGSALGSRQPCQSQS